MKVRPDQGRSGTILICVLACLMIAISMAGTCIQMTLRSRREARRELQQRQAEWILNAGIQRAVRQLNASAGYKGETWEIPGGALGSARDEAICQITVHSNSNPGNSLEQPVEVIAWFGPQNVPENQTRLSHTFGYSKALVDASAKEPNSTESQEPSLEQDS